jgi:hypothetical protein
MRAEEEFLDVIGKKNLKTFAPCYSQSPQTAEFTPLCGFLYLRFQQQQLTVGGGFGIVYIISLKVA